MNKSKFLRVHFEFERQYNEFCKWVKENYPTPRFVYTHARPLYPLSSDINDIKTTVSIVRNVRFGGHEVIDTVDVPKPLLDAHYASIEAINN